LPEAHGDERGPAPVATAGGRATGDVPEGTTDEPAPDEPTEESALGEAAPGTDAARHPGRRRLRLVAAVSAIATLALLITLAVLRPGWGSDGGPSQRGRVVPSSAARTVIQKMDLPIMASSTSVGEIKVDWSGDPRAADAFNVELQVSQREVTVSGRPSFTTIRDLNPTGSYCIHVSAFLWVEDFTPTPAPLQPVCLAADGRGVIQTSSQ
jgi:hypothetical protein